MSLKVAVIYGSRTCEHDVSIVSALQAMDNLDKNEYEIVPVYIARDVVVHRPTAAQHNNLQRV